MANPLLLLEGSSITVGSNTYGLVYSRQSGIPWTVVNVAANGSQIEDLIAQEAATASNYVADAINVLAIEIGANDFAAIDNPTNDATFADLLAYCSRMRALDFKVCLWTILPRAGVPNFETNRGRYNPEIRAAVGDSIDAFIDGDQDALMGPVAQASDAEFYADGTHPTTLGTAHLARIAAPVFDSFGLGSAVGKRRFRIVF